MIYISVLILLLFLSIRYDINGKENNKDFWYNVMLVVFILVAGLRWRLGIDTPNYLGNFYHLYPSLENLSVDDLQITSSPLYVLINSVVKSLGGRFYIVQLIHATFVNVLIFKYIRKHSSYIFTCLFFYAITCYTTYNMETMRASMAIVVCLYANDYAMDKKWLKAYSLYIIAVLFHPQSIIFLIFPLFFFLRFNKIGVLLLFIAFFVGKLLSVVLQDYIFLLEGDDALSDKISGYVESDVYGADIKGGIIYFLLSQAMPMIYIVLSLLYVKKYRSSSVLSRLEPMVIIGIGLLLIKLNFYIAYRYVDCYKIYFVLFYSELLAGLAIRAKRLDRCLSLARSFAFFSPLILYIIFFNYISDKGKGYRYIPYTSVFERKIDTHRQKNYNSVNSTKYPTINREEY